MSASSIPAELDPAIDPGRPIIDPHLHLWDFQPVERGLQEPQTFLLCEAAETIAASGHNVTHSVFVECHAMYRMDGPPELRSLGETEFANGMAAMSAHGVYGPCRIAHRIVAGADLTIGGALESVIDAHRARAGERLRGFRMNTSFSEAGLFGWPADPAAKARMSDPAFIAGAAMLARAGLSLDIWCLHPQLPQLIALADCLPDLPIILDHVGTPDLRGGHAGREDEVFAQWRQHMIALAERPNVIVKLSGLGMDVSRRLTATTGTMRSVDLAALWHPLITTVIELFGPSRCMFASNFPPDRSAAGYGTLWNAFKRIAAGYSDDEEDRLFRRTAAATYQIYLGDEATWTSN